MLQVSLNTITVNPQRADAPSKTFASNDVPHGTDSCIYKSAKVLQSNGHQLSVGLPAFTQAEIDALVATNKAALQVQPLFVPDAEDPDILIPVNPMSYDRSKAIDVSDEEAAKEFFSQFPLPLPTKNLQGEDIVPAPVQPKGALALADQQTPAKVAAALAELAQPSFMPGMSSAKKYDSQAAAKAKLLDDRKQALAVQNIKKAIDECLIVPTLSDAFKAQFETHEVA